MAAVKGERIGLHPNEILEEAVAATRARGITVEPGPHGVRVAAGSRRLVMWERDESPAVSPYGALCLHAQPQSADLNAAVSLALDAPPSYVSAYLAGLNNATLPDAGNGDEVRLRSIAYECGAMLRAKLLRPRSVGARS